MIEAEARKLLLKAGYDALDAWIATQPWTFMPGGWRAVPSFQGWLFRVEVAGAERLRITADAPGGIPAVWEVPYRR
jgi:hypothetical protein